MKFLLGDGVIVYKEKEVGGFRTCGLIGTVRKVVLEPKPMLCVRLFISTIFQPMIWYTEDFLVFCDNAATQAPLAAYSIKDRNYKSLDNSKFSEGIMRAWLVAVTNAKIGQALYDNIEKATQSTLFEIYYEPSLFAKWLDKNDSRVRRRIAIGDSAINPELKITRR